MQPYVHIYTSVYVHIYIHVFPYMHLNTYLHTHINFIDTYLASTSLSRRLETEWGVTTSIDDSEMFDQNGPW